MQPNSFQSRAALLSAATLTAILWAPAALANLYWDANGATAGSGTPAAGTWDTGTSWSSSAAGDVATTAWADGQPAVFSAGTAAAGTWNIAIAGTVRTPSILFNSTADTVHNITGGTLDIGTAGLSLDASAAAGTTNRSNTISSAIVGSGGLTIAANGDTSATGAGSNTIFSLTGANTFSGDVTITSGVVGYTSNFGAAANKIQLDGGGLVFNTTGTFTRDIVAGAAGGILRNYGAATTTYSGVLSGSGSLARTDGGVFILTQPATHTGAWNLQRGTLQIGNGTQTADLIPGASSIVLGDDTGAGVLQYQLDGSATLPANVTFANLASAIVWQGKDAADTLTLSAPLGDDITKGYLRVDSGTLALGAGADVKMMETQAQCLPANSPTALRGVISVGDGASLTTGYINLGSANTTSGVINQTGGTVTLLPGGAGIRIGHWTNGAGPGSVYALSGGTLDGSGLDGNTGDARLLSIGWDGAAAMTIGGGSSPAVAKFPGVKLDRDRAGDGVSAATLTLSANGSLQLGNSGIVGQGANDALVLDGGSILATSDTAISSRIVANPGTTSTIDINGYLVSLSGAVTGDGALHLNNATPGSGSVQIDFSGATRLWNTPLAGNADVYKYGDGILNLQGSHTLNGILTVLEGGVLLNGDADFSLVDVDDAATFGGEGALAGNLQLGYSTGTKLTIDPATPGALAVSGTVTLTGVNELKLSGAPPLGAPITVFTHGGLSGTPGTNLVLPGAANYSSAIFADTGSAVTLTLGAQELTWTGTGGASWDVGTSTNWSNGGASSFHWADRVTFTNAGAGTVNLTGSLAPGVVTVNSTANYTFAGTGSLAEYTTLVKAGTSTLTLSTANTYDGITSVNAGILKLGNPKALGSILGNTVVAAGATLDANGQDLGAPSEPIVLSGTGVGGIGALTNTATTLAAVNDVTLADDASINVDASKSLFIGTYAGGNAATGKLELAGKTLTKTGAGTLILNGVTVSSGNIAINQGTVRLMREYDTQTGHVNFNQAPTTLGGTGTLTINAGATLTTDRWNAGLTISMPMVLNGGTFTSDWPGPNGINVTSPISVTANSTLGFGGGYGNITLSGPITGTGRLTRTGGETVNLTGANTWDGGAWITSGAISFNSGSLGTGPVTLDGGILRWNAGNTEDVSSRLTMVAAKNGNLDTSDNAVVFATAIGNGVAAPLIKQGTGSLKLAPGNTYTGATQIQAGTLILPAATNPVNPGSFVLGTATTAGKLRLEGTAQTAAALTTAGTGNAIVGGSPALATFTLDSATNSSFNGSFGGTGTDENNLAVVKAGTGTLTLTGASTHTGATAVNAGTLLLKGSLSGSPTTVAAAGTLQGSGSIGGALTVAGTLSPGNPPPTEQNKLIRTAVTATGSTVTTTNDFQELHNTTGTVVPANTSYVYTGDIYLPGAAGTVYYFGENFDDEITLSINGTAILTANAWNVIGAGSFTSPGAGWYPIRLSAYQGGGGVGGVTGSNWSATKGVGFATTAPATATDGAAYQAFTFANLTTAGIKLRTADAMGTLTATAGATLTGTYVCEIDGTTNDLLAVTGNLNLSGASLNAQVLSGGIGLPAHIIATYTNTLTGTFASHNLPSGYTINYAYNGKNVAIVPGTGGSAYQTWATANGIGSASPNADSDGDGIANGIEFVIGGDPSGPNSASHSLLPTVSTDATYLNFVFRRTTESAGNTPYVQYGSDLSGWTKAQNGVAGVVIEEVPNGFGTGIDRVTVKVPRSLAGTGQKFFTRLGIDL